MPITPKDARNIAIQLQRSRRQSDALEEKLQKAIAEFLSDRSRAAEWAREIGVTPQYLSDIRHGRRKISDAVLAKILDAGAEK